MPLWIRTGEAVGRVGGILVPGCFHVSVCPWPRCEAISPTCLPSWDPDLIVISLSTDSRRLPLILHISACLAFFLTHFISHISFPLYIYFLTSPPPFLPFLIYLIYLIYLFSQVPSQSQQKTLLLCWILLSTPCRPPRPRRLPSLLRPLIAGHLTGRALGDPRPIEMLESPLGLTCHRTPSCRLCGREAPSPSALRLVAEVDNLIYSLHTSAWLFIIIWIIQCLPPQVVVCKCKSN